MSKNKEIKHEIMPILPKTAEEWLKKNKDNRKVKERAVAYYSKQIADGDWSITGETIIFDWNGNLRNGQHRLLACVQAGKPITSLVVFGVDPKSFKHMDIGVGRTVGDMAGIAGHGYAVQKASAARTLMGMKALAPGDAISRIMDGNMSRPTMSESLEVIDKYDDILEEGCKIVYLQASRPVMRPPSLFIGLYTYLHEMNAQRAKEFFTKLASGEDLPSSSPIWKLRERLIVENQVKGMQGRRAPYWKAAVVVKVWNAWMRGDTVSKILVRDEEGWPKIEKRAHGGEIAIRKKSA